jgi:hypothetical protein
LLVWCRESFSAIRVPPPAGPERRKGRRSGLLCQPFFEPG